MPSARVQLSDSRTAFRPRETIAGKVTWEFDAAPKSAELSLKWWTRGRGIADYGVAETVPFADPQATETRSFTITLPEGPYSFSGTLITLTWTLELILEPGNVADGVDITIAPDGKPISLPSVKSTFETSFQ
jgi:hypothetical protein